MGYFEDAMIAKAVRDVVGFGGQRTWSKRYEALTRDSQRGASLEHHHVEIVLYEADRRLAVSKRGLLGQMPDLDGYAVAVELSGWHRELNQNGKKRLEGSIRDALNSDWGFAPLRCELTARMALRAIGCTVVAADMEGEERIDFLVTRGEDQAEIECKFITHDFGRSFRGREFYALKDLLMKEVDRFAGSGISVVVRVEISRGLPSNRVQLRRLAEAIGQAVVGAQPDLREQLGVCFFREEWPPGCERPELVHAEARYRSDMECVATLAMDRPGFALLVEVEDPADSRGYEKRLVRRLKEAADQLSGERPGALFVELQGSSPRFARDNPAADLVGRLFPQVCEGRPHLELVVLGFPGPPYMMGTTHHFRNPTVKDGQGSRILDDLAATSVNEESENLPFSEFRRSWWSPKYSPDLAAERNMEESLGRLLARLKRKSGEG